MEMPNYWTIKEVALITSDYFDMLTKELSGQDYNKSEHRRNLQKMLNSRSESSIEFKHQNISAILIEMGLPYISGYKPMPNYQQLLREEVENHLTTNTDLDEAINRSLASDIELPEPDDILKNEVNKPDVSIKITDPSSTNKKYRVKRNYYKEELRNRKLGLLGEKFILSFEKKRLLNIGLQSLADNIEHISQTQGDSAGFDILSFDEEGDEKFIEVKTTRMGKEAPFYFTRNELGFSKEQQTQYSLYRVFEFSKRPKFYQLKGSLDKSCESVSTEYMGWPK